jgi:hypothetical protein
MTKGAVIPQEMADALRKFSDESGHINDTIVNDLVSKRELPPVIYHYTNDLGLRGILETGIFWLTDIFNLNDPSELRHGFSHAINALNNMAATGPPESKFFAERFEAFDKEIQNSAHFFVCSFSSCGDDLGQWRAYADNGRGYTLGFDAKVIEDAFMNEGKTRSLDNATFPVIYNDRRLAEIQRQLIERMFHLISLPHGRNLGRDSLIQYLVKLSVLLTRHALYSALYFKHEAYSNEKEYRFLQILPWMDASPPEVKFRSRSYSLVRYREFDWRTLASKALKEIKIGPAADKEKASQFALECLREFNTTHTKLTYSAIPYRA